VIVHFKCSPNNALHANITFATLSNPRTAPVLVFSLQLSIINYQLSIINYQLSIINYQLSIINYQLQDRTTNIQNYCLTG